jgi:hypothetical protein
MTDLSNDQAVSWRVTRTRDALEVAGSLDEKAADFQVIRQGYLVPSEEAEGGIMRASSYCEACRACTIRPTFDTS